MSIANLSNFLWILVKKKAMNVPFIRHPDFTAPLPVGHRLPMGKYGRLIQVLREEGLTAFW